jgi:ribosome-associated translation inhibitor RaiA
MEEQELGGNIALVGFNLDKGEMIVIKKMIGKYAEKIRHFTEYEQLKLEMRIHQKQEKKELELKVLLNFDGKRANAEDRGENPFVLIDSAMKRILAEIEHKIKK